MANEAKKLRVRSVSEVSGWQSRQGSPLVQLLQCCEQVDRYTAVASGDDLCDVEKLSGGRKGALPDCEGC